MGGRSSHIHESSNPGPGPPLAPAAPDLGGEAPSHHQAQNMAVEAGGAGEEHGLVSLRHPIHCSPLFSYALPPPSHRPQHLFNPDPRASPSGTASPPGVAALGGLNGSLALEMVGSVEWSGAGTGTDADALSDQ